MDDRSKLVKSLSADDLRRLMERLKKGQGSAGRIGRAPRDGAPLPLSFSQERLWFLDRLGAGASAYNVPAAVRLAGALDPSALQRTFAEVARRHEALRTTFGERDGVPFQVIAAELGVPLPVADLSALPAEASERETLRLATEEAGRPFDLARGPLFRTLLFRLGAAEHVLTVTLHHIVSDGWSTGVLVREMAALYDAFAAGRPSPLPELPIQYADYAVWQRQRLQGEALEKELAFWRERLTGVPPLELPTDRPRPAQASFRGGHRAVELAADALSGLNALCRESEGTTLYMVLLAGFETLLLRYSGQDDFAVGAPVANRGRSETEGLIGFFVNTLALRATLAGDLTFRGLLRRVKETTLAAFAHEDMPFDKLVEELQPDREPGRNPLFQVITTLQNQPRTELAMGGLELEGLGVETGTAKVDLTVAWAEADGRLYGSLEYSSALFDGATAERLARHFATLLGGAVADPDRTLWELPLLDAAERRQTLVDWNRTAAPFPREAAIHELFAAQAARHPGAVAVEFGDQRLTYGELDARANRLAHRLRRLGVGPEALVVLSIPRSLEMIEGMVGILKAGGAYLPLDPTLPRERLAFLVEESRPAAVVTLEAHLDALPDFGERAVCLDRDRAGLAAEPADEPRSGVTADNLVYVLYTSGSTGRPKAVAVPHRGLVRLVVGADYARLDAGETFFQFAPLSFDPSTLEIFGALANGGRLAVAPAGPFSLAELGRIIRRHGVTTLWLTSGLFHQMIEEGLDDLRGVRQLLSGGDVLSPAHIRRALEALPEVEIIDGYGPTENSCFTTCYRVDRDDPPAAYVPIGKPMANTTVYILDRELRPVPVGVPGELFTGGEGLARGYRGRPELTAERFVPSPLAGEVDPPGARLYRTGDLSRWRPDGNVEFLGRMDSQVKIRGYRIEPGEVEAVLAGHPALAECAVVVRREDNGERRLVACYVAAAPVTPAELKEHLGLTLPAYMVPSAFLELPALPLTVSGKVDRRALSRLEAPAGDGPSETYAEPETPVERQIAAIWRDLLKHERIGLHDSFFDLGGHSLLATRVLSRLRETLNADLSLAVVFERPTLAGLAAAVEEALGTPAGAALGGPGTEAPPAGPDLPLSFSQERLWFLEQLQPGTSAYNVATPVRLRGAVDPGALAGALREVIRRHQVLRVTFGEREGQPVQWVSPSTAIPLPVVDLSALPAARREAEGARVTALEAQLPFDLARGPIVRALLTRLEPADQVLVLTLHHITSDGWSMGILVQELLALYQAALAGLPSPLPELPRQYFDFARWQRHWLRGETLERLLAYWRQALAGAPEVLELPADRPRPPVRSFHGHLFRFAFDEAVTRGLKTIARDTGTTLFMTLLAGLDVLLARYSRQADIAVGSPIANRTRGEYEGLIGFFVNTLVLRVQAEGSLGFHELLGQVRRVTLGAYEHQDLPFERIVEELRPERSLSHSPLFQVVLALQNNEAPAFALPGLTAELLPVGVAIAKFDLTLFLSEDQQGGLAGVAEYAADLFEEPTVARLSQHLGNLLAAAAAAPRTPLAELPLLAAAESRQILLDSAGEPLPAPAGGDDLLHRAFELQAARTPGAEALVWGEQRWTYGELNARANRLAHRLRALGVGPESLVAVLMQRTADLVTALFAVLKAGGAYVPLDPNYPEERIAFALEDTGAAVAIADETLAGRLGRLPRSAGAPADPAGGLGGHPGRGRGEPRRPPRPGEPRLRHLHLRLHRPPQGGRHPPRRGRRAGPLVADGVPRRGPRRRARLDLDLLRHVGLRAVRDAGARRPHPARRRRPGAAAAAGRRRGHPRRHRADGDRRAGARRRGAALGPRRQPRRRAAQARADRRRLLSRPRPRGDQPLRPLRGHHLLHLGGDRPRLGGAAEHRPPALRLLALHPRPGAAAGPARGARRGLHRRRRALPRLPQPAGADRREVRAGPVRHRRSGGPPLPHRRPRPLPPGPRDRLPRPSRPPDQGARLPRRARGGRGGPAAPSGGARRGGDRARRRRRPRPGRLRGGGPRARAAAARLDARDPPRADGPRGVRAPGGAAADAERQDRPQGAAGARGGGGRRAGGARRAAHAAGGGARRDLARGAEPPPGRGPRRLLRARRPLAARHPRRRPRPPGARRQPLGAPDVRGLHPRDAGQGGGGGGGLGIFHPGLQARRRDPPAGGRPRPAALVPAGAPLVSRPPRARRGAVQHRGHRAAHRRPAGRRARRHLQRGAAPARGAAHRLRHRRGGAPAAGAAVHRAGRAADRRLGPAASRCATTRPGASRSSTPTGTST